MKVVRIDKYRDPDLESVYTIRRKYRVEIGNGAVHHFTNKKHVKQFLAKCNRFLTLKGHELNALYVQVFGAYRSYWFSIDRQTRYQLEYKFNRADNALYMAVYNAHTTNGNYFTFTHLYTMIAILQEICGALHVHARQRNDYMQAYAMENLLAQLKSVSGQLKNYSYPDTTINPE